MTFIHHQNVMLLVYLITVIHGWKIANGATNCLSVWTENNIYVFSRWL